MNQDVTSERRRRCQDIYRSWSRDSWLDVQRNFHPEIPSAHLFLFLSHLILSCVIIMSSSQNFNGDDDLPLGPELYYLDHNGKFAVPY